MRVRATMLGYYELVRRRKGDEFVLKARKTTDGETVTPEQQFSEKWMELVDPKVKAKAKAKSKRKSKKQDDPEKSEEEPAKVGEATGDQAII